MDEQNMDNPRALYNNVISMILSTTNQIWKLAYYVLIIQFAIIGFYIKYPSQIQPNFKVILIIMSIIVTVLGVIVLESYLSDIKGLVNVRTLLHTDLKFGKYTDKYFLPKTNILAHRLIVIVLDVFFIAILISTLFIFYSEGVFSVEPSVHNSVYK